MGIYQTFYDLMNTYIFGGGLVNGSYEELCTILFSMSACFFVLGIPFFVIGLCLYFIVSTILKL